MYQPYCKSTLDLVHTQLKQKKLLSSRTVQLIEWAYTVPYILLLKCSMGTSDYNSNLSTKSFESILEHRWNNFTV